MFANGVGLCMMHKLMMEEPVCFWCHPQMVCSYGGHDGILKYAWILPKMPASALWRASRQSSSGCSDGEITGLLHPCCLKESVDEWEPTPLTKLEILYSLYTFYPTRRFFYGSSMSDYCRTFCILYCVLNWRKFYCWIFILNFLWNYCSFCSSFFAKRTKWMSFCFNEL